MTSSTWDGPPGDIIGDLKKVTEKMQEVHERYDHYTDIYITDPAWKKLEPHLEKMPYERSQGLLYSIPIKIFNSFEDMCVALVTVALSTRVLMISLDNDGNLYSLSLAEVMDKYSMPRTQTPTL